jgi:hypothetical protein
MEKKTEVQESHVDADEQVVTAEKQSLPERSQSQLSRSSVASNVLTGIKSVNSAVSKKLGDASFGRESSLAIISKRSGSNGEDLVREISKKSFELIDLAIAPAPHQEEKPKSSLLRAALTEITTIQDWWCLWIALVCFGCCLIVSKLEEDNEKVLSLRKWNSNPVDAWETNTAIALAITLVVYGVLLSVESWFCKKAKLLFSRDMLLSYGFVFMVALLSHWLGAQKDLKKYGLGYALWAFLVGALLSNSLPKLISKLGPVTKQAEFFIKCGVVLLAAPLEDIRRAGAPGLAVAWGESLVTWHIMIAVGHWSIDVQASTSGGRYGKYWNQHLRSVCSHGCGGDDGLLGRRSLCDLIADILVLHCGNAGLAVYCRACSPHERPAGWRCFSWLCRCNWQCHCSCFLFRR